MKKFIAAFVSLVAIVAVCAVMSACSAGFAGTYKFSKMSMEQGGISVEIKSGESYMGITLTENAYTLEIKEDNTFVMTVNMGTETTQEGKWEQKDGKYYLVAEGESIEVPFDGKTIIFEMDGVKVELKK